MGQILLTEVLDKIQDNMRHPREVGDGTSEVEEGEKPVPRYEVLIGPPKEMQSVARVQPFRAEDLDEDMQRKLDEIQKGYEAFMTSSKIPMASIAKTSSLQLLVIPTQTKPLLLLVRVPLIEPLHRERTVTLTLPIETMAKSSAHLVGIVP